MHQPPAARAAGTGGRPGTRSRCGGGSGTGLPHREPPGAAGVRCSAPAALGPGSAAAGLGAGRLPRARGSGLGTRCSPRSAPSWRLPRAVLPRAKAPGCSGGSGAPAVPAPCGAGIGRGEPAGPSRRRLGRGPGEGASAGALVPSELARSRAGLPRWVRLGAAPGSSGGAFVSPGLAGGSRGSS